MPETVWPAGSGTSPTYIVPNRPLGTASWPWAWAWYMPIAGSVTVNSVGVGLAGGDEVLGDRGHAVLVVGDVDAVPVDVGADRQLVGELDLDPVADLEVDARAGDHPVVRPRLDDLAGADLPVDDATPSARSASCRRAAPRGRAAGCRAPRSRPGRPGSTRSSPGPAPRPPPRSSVWLVVLRGRAGGFVGRPLGGRAVATDRQRGGHAGLGVAGDRAVDLVGARLRAR